MYIDTKTGNVVDDFAEFYAKADENTDPLDIIQAEAERNREIEIAGEMLTGFSVVDLNKGGDPVVRGNGEVIDICTGEVMETTQSTALTTTKANAEIFPFTLADLDSWVIKRHDGTIVKYILDTKDKSRMRALTDPHAYSSSGPAATNQQYAGYHATGLSSYCNHAPKDDPSWSDPQGRFTLHMADEYGAKTNKHKFDMVLDCGAVVPDYAQPASLYGDPIMVQALKKHDLTPPNKPRILRFDWPDRQAPDLHPQFWVDLIPHLKGRVIVNCQGGHGRSGTALVCLMMAQSDYDALDAITHLRAIHCPRAIESSVQHAYINWMAEFLGRNKNADDAAKVKNFKDRFLEDVNSKFAETYQQRLVGK